MRSTTTAVDDARTGLGGPFQVEQVDVRGVPTLVWTAAPRSLHEVWEASRAHGDADYLVYEDERLTYADAHQRVDGLAAVLAERYGVGRADRVAIAMRNRPEWALSFWAAVALGAVAVPLNAWWTGPELAYGLADSGATVLLADGERLERLAPHLDELRLAGVVAVRTDGAPAGTVPFADVVADGQGRPRPEVQVDPDDDVTIMYTSGTTGRPKGAVGTHRNICNFLCNGLYAAATRAAAEPPVPEGAAVPAPPATLLTFPLFHVGGLQSHLIPYTAYGGKLVLLYKWDADQAVDLIERERATAFSGVPMTAFGLLERAAEKGVSLSSLAGLSSSSTLVPPELVRRVDSQFASRVAPANGYGLTETTGSVVELRDEELPRNATGKVLKRQLRDELSAARATSA